MAKLNKKLEQFTESVIRSMTRLALEHDAINLSQGFPDFPPPKTLTNAARMAGANGPHQYAITWGAKNFREALAEKQKQFMGLELDPDKNMVVTCGSTEAMMVAMMTACNRGDKVIIFSPFYENYGADAILTGAKPIFVSLYPPEYTFDLDELRKAFQQGAKAIILCNPSNPTGKVFSKKELENIAELAKEYDAFVITDEVYEHIIYPPNKHVYMASLPDMFERTISCSSLSKTYSITGWRLGYIIASEPVINAAKKVHDFLTVGAASPLQEAAVTALKLPHSYYRDLQYKYLFQRDLFLDYLDQLGLRYTKPEGAYYVMVDIGDFGFKTDIAFCKWLTEEVGVAGVPGSSFFHKPVNNLIRFHFAKQASTLKEAGQRLLQLKECL